MLENVAFRKAEKLTLFNKQIPIYFLHKHLRSYHCLLCLSKELVKLKFWRFLSYLHILIDVLFQAAVRLNVTKVEIKKWGTDQVFFCNAEGSIETPLICCCGSIIEIEL